MDVTATFSEEQVKLSGTRPINMYVVNASYSGQDYLYYINNNQNVYGYSLNASGNLTATEQLYIGLPVTRENIQTSIKGEVPTTSISVPNTDRAMESIIQNRNYLRGCEVFIISGFGKHLPTGSTANHVGTLKDHNSFMSEKMYIDSTVSSEEAVSFSCKPKFEIKSATIPKRKYSRECYWALSGNYLGSECDPLASVNSASYLTCDGTLDQCRERDNEKRFGGFPSIPTKGIVVM